MIFKAEHIYLKVSYSSLQCTKYFCACIIEVLFQAFLVISKPNILNQSSRCYISACWTSPMPRLVVLKSLFLIVLLYCFFLLYVCLLYRLCIFYRLPMATKASTYTEVEARRPLLVLWWVPHVVGAQLCRLPSVDANTVGLKPLMGKYLDSRYYSRFFAVSFCYAVLHVSWARC